MRKTIAFLLGVSWFSANVAFAGALAPKKPSQIVTLVFADTGETGSCSFGRQASFQVMSDGTTGPFAGVPEGQVLMVTGMQVSSYSAPASLVATFEVRAPNAVVTTAGCLADSGSECHGSVSFLSGIPFRSGTTLCVNSLSVQSYYVTMQGYLTKDK